MYFSRFKWIGQTAQDFWTRNLKVFQSISFICNLTNTMNSTILTKNYNFQVKREIARKCWEYFGPIFSQPLKLVYWLNSISPRQGKHAAESDVKHPMNNERRNLKGWCLACLNSCSEFMFKASSFQIMIWSNVKQIILTLT